MTDQEIPKRLAPSAETLRELYLKSGNQCAYPGCRNIMINEDGQFIGQVCHIEAAEPRGERFNPSQSNEDRRQFSNLMLMCYEHHTVTNDVSKFTVERMRKMKEEHEKKFFDVVGTIRRSIVDHATLSGPNKSISLRKITSALEWSLTDDDLVPMVQEVSELADRLSVVPIPARELFAIILNRAESGAIFCAPEAEVRLAADLDVAEMRNMLAILDKYGFVSDGGNDFFGVHMLRIKDAKSGWPIWQDIKNFCTKEEVNISQIVVGLDFSVLD